LATSREGVLKAIDHVQPEVTPVRVMGFDSKHGASMERWLEQYGAADYQDLRLKLDRLSRSR
jgi:hypothetical protein